jgi:hypothetical protein
MQTGNARPSWKMATLGLALATLTSCSKAYPVRVTGVVKSSADGSPVAGVRVALEMSGLGEIEPVTTNVNGVFSFPAYRVSDAALTFPGAEWSLVLSLTREGYADEMITFYPGFDTDTDTSFAVSVLAYLRPVDQVDRELR